MAQLHNGDEVIARTTSDDTTAPTSISVRAEEVGNYIGPGATFHHSNILGISNVKKENYERFCWNSFPV